MILTDTVMFLLFSGIIVITCFFIVDAAGGWFSAIESLAVYEAKPGIIAWHGRIGPDVHWQTEWEALIWASILGVAWGIVVAVSPWQTSRYLMVRSEHVVLRSACGALIAMLLLYLITNFAAATVNLINPDITPAAFWVVNPNNILRHNSAAGGTHFGFWFRIQKHPDGPSATTEYCSNKVPLGTFQVRWIPKQAVKLSKP